MDSYIIKCRSGKYLRPMTVTPTEDRLYFNFAYDEYLKNEVKLMEGARWDPENKQWHVKNCRRNLFQLKFLSGENPYAPYDSELKPFTPKRKCCYLHQVEMTSHVLTRKQCILAAEMRTGKTLALIEAIEASGVLDWWWIAPKSALFGVQLEFIRWKLCENCGELKKNCPCKQFVSNPRIPGFFTYEALRKLVDNWPASKKPPRGVVFDESSRLKTPTAQRSQAAYNLTEEMRKEYEDDCYIVEMSGSPAPKSPIDWFFQCLSGDTLVLTSNGPKKISKLQNQNTLIYVNSLRYAATKSWSTGKQATYKITTKDGVEVIATETHRFLRESVGVQSWTKVKDLKVKDTLVLNDHEGVNWSSRGTFEEGYLCGHWQGDGSKSNAVYILCLWKKDHELLPFIENLLPDCTLGKEGPNGKLTIYSKILTSLIRHYGEDLPEHCSSSFYEGYIAGLFDTDGCVEKGRARLRISQSNEALIKEVQQILLFLGIRSTQHKMQAHTSVIEGRNVMSQDNFNLVISGEYAHRFAKRIGFRLSYKKLKSVKNYGKISNLVTIKSITLHKEEEEVFDITVPAIACFSANAFMSHNCEIACPGFLKEGDMRKFQRRLSVIEERQSVTGGTYPHLVTWKDSELKCDSCGYEKDTHHHVLAAGGHTFKPGVNEVARLYKRMNGLVLVKFKKECLDLPPKEYKIIELPPTPDMVRAATIINAKCTSAVQALTLMRELSDGFQYKEEEVGFEKCDLCKGSKLSEETYDLDDPDSILDPLSIQRGHKVIYDESGFTPIDELERPLRLGKRVTACYNCSGTGEVVKTARGTKYITSPKEAALIDLIDQHEEAGRFVVYAGFTGSVDKCVEIFKRQKWDYIRVDGRGWESSFTSDPIEMLSKFADLKSLEQIGFVGQPAAAGMGIDLSASPGTCYYSNDFNAESRIQSEERTHGPDMRKSLGCTIYDLICLSSDIVVLNNLKRKRRLQNMSLGEMQAEIAAIKFSDMRYT